MDGIKYNCKRIDFFCEGVVMMKVIHTQRIANDKIALLMNGYSAFAESEEVIRLVNRRIHRNNLNIIVERTNVGCWFIPEQLNKAQ